MAYFHAEVLDVKDGETGGRKWQLVVTDRGRYFNNTSAALEIGGKYSFSTGSNPKSIISIHKKELTGKEPHAEI